MPLPTEIATPDDPAEALAAVGSSMLSFEAGSTGDLGCGRPGSGRRSGNH